MSRRTVKINTAKITVNPRTKRGPITFERRAIKYGRFIIGEASYCPMDSTRETRARHIYPYQVTLWLDIARVAKYVVCDDSLPLPASYKTESFSRTEPTVENIVIGLSVVLGDLWDIGIDGES